MPSVLEQAFATSFNTSKINVVIDGNVDASANTRNIILIVVLLLLAVILLCCIIALARSNNARYARTDYESDDDDEDENDKDGSNEKKKNSQEGEGEEHEDDMSEISASHESIEVM